MSTIRCGNCNKPATIHMTEIRNGTITKTHLCERCAAEAEGVPAKGHTPLNKLLADFVTRHSGGAAPRSRGRKV